MKRRKTPSCSSSSAATLGGNDDLLTELLLFCPAKSLIRFKSVNKQWRTLISSPSFARLHTLRHFRRPDYAFLLRIRPSPTLVLDPTVGRLIPFDFGIPCAEVIQSCNGLLLVEGRNSKYSIRGEYSYYIFNPTTLQSRRLKLPRKDFSRLCLIFNPSESLNYRVIMFLRHLNPTKSLVYHSENHEWKEGGESCMATYNFWIGGNFNNGVYFFKSRVSSTRIKQIPNPQPNNPEAANAKDYTIELNGYLLHLRLSSSINQLRLYRAKKIENGWSQYKDIDFNPISAALPGNNGGAVELLGIIQGETTRDWILVFHVPGKIMIYSFGGTTFEELVDFTEEYYYVVDELQFRFDRDVCRFIHSLAPV